MKLAIIGIMILLCGCTMIQETPPTGQTVSEKPLSAAIRITQNGFIPRELQVPAGTEVIWTNTDSKEHTLSFSSIDFEARLTKGASADYLFNEKGEYEYASRTTGDRGHIIVT